MCHAVFSIWLLQFAVYIETRLYLVSEFINNVDIFFFILYRRWTKSVLLFLFSHTELTEHFLARPSHGILICNQRILELPFKMYNMKDLR